MRIAFTSVSIIFISFDKYPSPLPEAIFSTLFLPSVKIIRYAVLQQPSVSSADDKTVLSGNAAFAIFLMVSGDCLFLVIDIVISPLLFISDKL